MAIAQRGAQDEVLCSTGRKQLVHPYACWDRFSLLQLESKLGIGVQCHRSEIFRGHSWATQFLLLSDFFGPGDSHTHASRVFLLPPGPL